MEILPVGRLIKDGENVRRDAIHIAIAPVVAGEPLEAGRRVCFAPNSFERVVEAWGEDHENAIGIVDPFLVGEIGPGARGLKEEKEGWLRGFAYRLGIGYEELMTGADDWVENGEYLNFGGLLEGESVPAEFWEHYQRVRRVSVPPEKRQNFFTCAC